MDYFSPSERKILDDLLRDVINNNINGSQASEITHKEIRAWKIAYDATPNSQMNYADEFMGLAEKKEDEMTIPELNFIKYMEFSDVYSR